GTHLSWKLCFPPLTRNHSRLRDPAHSPSLARCGGRTVATLPPTHTKFYRQSLHLIQRRMLNVRRWTFPRLRPVRPSKSSPSPSPSPIHRPICPGTVFPASSILQYLPREPRKPSL